MAARRAGREAANVFGASPRGEVGGAAARGDSRVLRRRIWSGPQRSCRAARDDAGASDRVACFDELPRLFFGVRAGVCVSRGIAQSAGDAAIGGPTQESTGGKRGDCGESDRSVSVRNAGRLEIAGTHAHGDVSNGQGWIEPVGHWRSRAIRANLAGAIRGAGARMSVIEVHAPGLLTTVQDLGREGFGPMGVSPSGAADAVALRVGNRLVGNVEGAAALEMTLLGGTFLFPEGALAALTGSDFGAALDGADRLPWASFEVKPGQTLRLGPTRSGARC